MLRKVYRQVRKHVHRFAGHEYRSRRQIEIRHEHLGSDYGGWVVCPTGVGSDTVVYSCGLGGDITFDLAMIERFGVQVHGFDPTPEAIEYIGSQTRPEAFHLHPWGIADHDGTACFRKPRALPKRAKAISQNYSIIDAASNAEFIEVQVRRLKTIMRELGHDRIDILKLDIEGAEYTVIDDMIESGLLPRQVLVEVHHHFQTVEVSQTKRLLSRLNDAGYRIFDVGASWHDYSLIRGV